MVTIAVIHTRPIRNTRFADVTIALHQVYCGNIAIIHTRNSPYTMLTVVTIAVIHARNSLYKRFIVITIAVIHTIDNIHISCIVNSCTSYLKVLTPGLLL